MDTEWEPYVALALAVRDRMIERWIRTQDTYYRLDAKRVYYLSLEFLMGRTLGNSLINLGLQDECAKALHELGYELEDLREAEWDAGLGNGGLGRLAACFLDSMATLGYPAYGYGIRYEYGIFHQRIVDGAQVEVPDSWLRYGNPWEIARPGDRFRSSSAAGSSTRLDAQGRSCNEWVDTEDVLAMPYDTPIPGYGTQTVNTLRLWGAQGGPASSTSASSTRATTSRAVEARAESENICRVLYPNDNVVAGKELRLTQEYFFVAATLQDIIRRYKKRYHMFDEPRGLRTFDRFAEKVAIQLNDTHPALAIPELMRLLVDVEGLAWDDGVGRSPRAPSATRTTPCCRRRWSAGRSTCSAAMLPRHLQIIYEINRASSHEVHGRGSRADDAPRPPDVDHRGGRRAAGAHGQPRHRRQPLRQRRGRAAHRDPEERRSSATSTSSGRSSSTTRPTASRRGAGCSSATRRWRR